MATDPHVCAVLSPSLHVIVFWCLRLAETLPATVQLYHLLLLELDRPGQAPVDLSGEQSPIRTNPIDAQLYGRRCKPVGVIAIR